MLDGTHERKAPVFIFDNRQRPRGLVPVARVTPTIVSVLAAARRGTTQRLID
jgi:hypothetical protein